MKPASLIEMLPVIALAMPLMLLLLCLSEALRKRMLAWLWLAPVPALGAVVWSVGGRPVVLSSGPYSIILALDQPGAVLLGVAAFLWIVAGFCAPALLRQFLYNGRFTVCWLLALTGSIGIFTAADLAGFFLFFAMVSLPAYGLIIHDGSSAARRAGAIYVGFALLGETLLLMGFVLLATASGTWTIAAAVSELPVSPWRDLTMALLMAGFGMKIGLLPVHFWMPVTYAATPIPAAAVLSGAAVKAGIIGLIRFLPLDVPAPDWGQWLAIVGLVTAFFGVAIGITQSNPKAVLAYSSISQMGFMATVFGMGLAIGSRDVALEGAFYAANHVLIKGALFLAIGFAVLSGPRQRWLVLAPAGLLALSLGGLPLTGGFVAKLAVKETLGDGIVGILAALSAAGTTLLMLHFWHRLASMIEQDSAQALPRRLILPWLLLAIITLILPWVLYSVLAVGRMANILTLSEIWKATWPILTGVGLAGGLRRWGRFLPRIPEGDVVALGPSVARAGNDLGRQIVRFDGFLRQWSVASLALILISVLLLLLMFGQA